MRARLVGIALIGTLLAGCSLLPQKYRNEIPCTGLTVTIADQGDVISEYKKRGIGDESNPRAFYDLSAKEIWVMCEPSVNYFETSLGKQLLGVLGCKKDASGEWDVSSVGIPKGMSKLSEGDPKKKAIFLTLAKDDSKYHSKIMPKLKAVIFADVNTVAQGYYDSGGSYEKKPRAFYNPNTGEIWVSDQACLEYFEGLLGHELIHALGCDHDEQGNWDLTPLGVPPIIQRGWKVAKKQPLFVD